MPDHRPHPAFTLSVRMPPHPLSVSAARRLIRSLEGWIDGETVKRAELVASEIVTNAIRHGSASNADTVELELEAARNALFFRVRDCGPPFALRARTPRPGDVGGFGLHIANSLADSLSVRRLASGNEVRFVISADLGTLFEP